MWQQMVQTKIYLLKRFSLMPTHGCMDHMINSLILLQCWLKVGNKLKEVSLWWPGSSPDKASEQN